MKQITRVQIKTYRKRQRIQDVFPRLVLLLEQKGMFKISKYEHAHTARTGDAETSGTPSG